MTQSAMLAIGTWGLTLYLLWNMQKINAIHRAMQGVTVQPASWIGRIVYLIIGVILASALFVGSALADGADPFSHIQNVLSKQQPVMQPLKPKETITFTPTAISTPTGTSIPAPTSTPIPSQTPTLAAVLPSPINLLPTPKDDDDKTPGWMKTPNGNGQGQFATPPGQGGIPPGQQKQTSEPNQPKPTKDNSNNSNSGNGSGKK